jgi:hypothetical protein
MLSRQIFNHTAPCAVKRAGIADGIRAGSSIIRQSSAILARFGEAWAGFVPFLDGLRSSLTKTAVAERTNIHASARLMTASGGGIGGGGNVIVCLQ